MRNAGYVPRTMPRKGNSMGRRRPTTSMLSATTRQCMARELRDSATASMAEALDDAQINKWQVIWRAHRHLGIHFFFFWSLQSALGFSTFYYVPFSRSWSTPCKFWLVLMEWRISGHLYYDYLFVKFSLQVLHFWSHAGNCASSFCAVGPLQAKILIPHYFVLYKLLFLDHSFYSAHI